MPDQYTIRQLIQKDDPAFEAVERLFEEMYAYMREHGLMMDLADDGTARWIRGVKNALGRFASLQLCLAGGEVVGFAHGSIKLAPDYLGSHKLGLVSHVYVQPAFRRSGAGRALVTELENWFREQGVKAIELQVLSPNAAAAEFWECLGYVKEIQQYRKLSN